MIHTILSNMQNVDDWTNGLFEFLQFWWFFLFLQQLMLLWGKKLCRYEIFAAF